MTAAVVTCGACGRDWPEDSPLVVPHAGLWFCFDTTGCLERSLT